MELLLTLYFTNNEVFMNPVSNISVIENPETALAIYDKIFTPREGYEIFFTPQIQKKGILVPAFFTLRNDYTEAFLTAVTKAGDKAFYISTTERVVPGPNDWLVSLNANSIQEYEKHRGIYRNVDNAIYSPNGKWGIWFSNDLYALIGGSAEFVDTFYGVLGKTIDEMVLTFIKSVQNTRHVLDEFLPQMFGEEQAILFRRLYGNNL